MKTVLKINDKPLLDEGKLIQKKEFTDLKKITTTEPINVVNYGYAQVIDENLKPENIVPGKTILGVPGNAEDVAKKILEANIYTYSGKVSMVGDRVFYNRPIKEVSLPNCSYIGEQAFFQCVYLSSISLPQCAYIGNYAFNGCSKLTSISLPMCSYIGNIAFALCTKLESIYLNVSSVPTLETVEAFYETPLSNSTYLGYYGSIYVPHSLYESFKKATNWIKFSNRFVSYSF